MEERLNQTVDQTENPHMLPEITHLFEQLLFTWGHLEQKAEKIGAVPFGDKKMILLEEMMNDAQQVDNQLKALMKAIKAL